MSRESPANGSRLVTTSDQGLAPFLAAPLYSSATWTETSLSLPEAMKRGEWEKFGVVLGQMGRGWEWWIGDWLNYGTRAYGTKYQDAEKIGYAANTLRIMAHIADRFQMLRRRNISWSVHREVAPLEESDQEMWLDRADAEDWGHKELRMAIGAWKRTALRDAKALKAGEVITDERIQILQADALETIRSLKDGSISLLLTDPPYYVTTNEWDIKQWPTERDYWLFMQDWLELLKPKMAAEYTAFVFCDADFTGQLRDCLSATGWDVLRQAIWNRKGPGKLRGGSRTFLSTYEPFWHCGTRDLNFPDVWGAERFDVQSESAPKSTDKDGAVHPTQKPVPLFERLIRVGSYENEIVFDPFCGSGTTAVVGHTSNRRVITCDTSAEYVAIAKGRLSEVFGVNQFMRSLDRAEALGSQAAGRV